MQGMDRDTGKLLDDREHLLQSIQMILETPLGSRVMRPEFGSELFDLVDAPMNDATNLRIYAATHDALSKWEPRLRTLNVQVEDRKPGEIILIVKAIYQGEEVSIDGIRISRVARA
ncbi:phage baseplate protein [Candidatus Poribacteria bacterium]|nr:phage baseplate protein [Candidatus Poribacteria bacterium]